MIRIRNFFSANWKSILFFGAIFGAIFLRLYSFDGWLLAKGDQVRDAMVIDRAFVGGAGELPLLGPRAGGTKLRLGPAFYYFQYLSAEVFGDTDLPTLAYPNLIFSIGSILVFYLLVRKFFEREISRALTVLYAFSFLAVEYSRFAWNPNSTPFFVFLFMLALMEIFNSSGKARWRWFFLAGLSYAVASQLHFTNFIGLPILAAIFLSFNRNNFRRTVSFSGAALFLSVILLCYVPVILNDMLSGGENAEQFFKAFGSKSSDSGAIENFADAAYLYGKYFFRILTGYLGSMETFHFAGLLFLLVGAAANVALWKKEADPERKNFLAMTISLFSAFFILYVPVGSGIDKPRFFLPIISLPLAYLGYIFVILKQKFDRGMSVHVAKFIFSVFLLSNLFFSAAWLAELSQAYSGAQNPKDTVVLEMKKDAAWWTWDHFQNLSAFVDDNCGDEEAYLSFSKNVREFEDVAQYALEKRNIKVHISKDPKESGSLCVFHVYRTGDDLPESAGAFEKDEEATFGSMSVSGIHSKNGVLTEEKGRSETEIENGSKDPSKFYWKDAIGSF